MKYFLQALSFCFCFYSNSQTFEVTPNGLKDSKNIEKSYVVVTKEGKSAKELYDNSLKYINKAYKNPEEVIKGKIDGEFLKFNTYVPGFTIVDNLGTSLAINAKYTVELSFKDGRVKYEVVELTMSATNGGYIIIFSGSPFDGYPIFNKKGELKREEIKQDIENHFNSVVKDLSKELGGAEQEDDW